jgi:hypothetical protein
MVLAAVPAALHQREHLGKTVCFKIDCLKMRLLLFSNPNMKKLTSLFSIIAASFVILCGANSFAQDTNSTVNSAIVPEPRSASWVKRHEGFVQEAKQEQIDLLFQGDSITDFWRRSGPRYGTNIWSKYYGPFTRRISPSAATAPGT